MYFYLNPRPSIGNSCAMIIDTGRYAPLAKTVSCLLASALVFVGCATTANAPDASPSPEHVAGLLTINDNLIVPGERIGPVFLGMTEQQLYHKLGEPTTTMTAPGTVNYAYPTTQLSVSVDAVTHKVWEIDLDTAEGTTRYSTAEGIKAGSSSLAVRTQLVGPYSTRDLVGGVMLLDYASGMTLLLHSNGIVTNISVWTPGHFHY
jgi:hypothetical protein